MPNCSRFVAFSLAIALLSGLHAQESVDRAAIEKELDAFSAQWEDAFNRHDAHKVALTYAQDCDVEHNFSKKSGRDAIEQWTVDYFRKNPQVQTKLVDVKRVILSSTAVVESGTWKEWNHTEPGLAQEGTYISTLVKSNGKWEGVHERAFSKTSAFPTFFHKVVGGSWHEQSGTQAIDTYQWVLGQKFIQLTSRLGERQTFAIIGMNPSSGELTWWSFHNDGTVELSRAIVENPLPNQHRLSIVSDSSLTDINMQIAFRGDDEVELEPQGKINGVQFNNAMLWKRSKQIADQGWLQSKPPAEIPPSMSAMHTLQGAKWIAAEMDGVPGVGGSQGGWILDGKFFLSSASFNDAANVSWSHVVIIGTDPEAPLMTKAWEFSSDGAVSTFHFSPDGNSLTGKSIGGMFGTIEFSGEYRLANGVLDYTARLNPVGQTDIIPYRWVYRDAQGVDN